jgi:hypothetical protein
MSKRDFSMLKSFFWLKNFKKKKDLLLKLYLQNERWRRDNCPITLSPTLL